ncbi:MAG: hypothetical protein ABI147_04220 [Acidobacteriaceae bacterium]
MPESADCQCGGEPAVVGLLSGTATGPVPVGAAVPSPGLRMVGAVPARLPSSLGWASPSATVRRFES